MEVNVIELDQSMLKSQNNIIRSIRSAIATAHNAIIRPIVISRL